MSFSDKASSIWASRTACHRHDNDLGSWINFIDLVIDVLLFDLSVIPVESVLQQVKDKALIQVWSFRFVI